MHILLTLTFTLKNFACPSILNSSSTSFMNSSLLILSVELVPSILVHSHVIVALYHVEILFYIIVSYTYTTSLWIDSMY